MLNDELAGFYRSTFEDEHGTAGERPLLVRKVRSIMGPLFEKLGWDATPGEDERTRVLRATLIRRLGTTGASTEIREEAVHRFDAGDLGGPEWLIGAHSRSALCVRSSSQGCVGSITRCERPRVP